MRKILMTAKELLARMVEHASINLMLMNVSAIQALMASTVIVTMTSVHHNLAEMGELVPGFGKVFLGFGI